MNRPIGISTLLAGMFVAGSAQALIIDNFSTDQTVFVSAAAPATLSGNAVESVIGGIISGDRDITVNKTTGPAGVVNAATAEATGGVLGVANGPTTNSNVHVLWDGLNPALTDLTAGGATGFYLSLPNPIDNALKIDFNVNGPGGLSTITKSFANGASGADFFFAFADFSVPTAFLAVSSIEMVLYSDSVAWDAQVDLVETRDRPPPPLPEPGTLGLIGLGLVGAMGLRRRKSA